MPTTIISLLITLFAVLPGLPAENIYSRIVGTDWREDRLNRLLRILGFSVVGLILYLVLGYLIEAPLPSYIFPGTFTDFAPNRELLTEMAVAMGGHFLGALVAASGCAYLARRISRFLRSSGYPDAWDKFVRADIPHHWVVVRTEAGEVYAGIMKRANISVQLDQRDVVLEEPAQYIEDQQIYIAMPYQYLFLSGPLIVSIAVVHQPGLDERVTDVCQPIFERALSNSEAIPK